MDLDQWADLEPTAFQQLLLDNCDTHEIYIVDLYNALIQKASEAPSRIVNLAEIAIDVFDSLGLTEEAILFLELCARSHLANNDVDQAISIITRITTINCEIAESVALDVAQDIVNCAEEFGISLDQRPRLLSLIESVFQHYGKREKIADLHIQSGGCPEFCVNGISFNAEASCPQTGW